MDPANLGHVELWCMAVWHTFPTSEIVVLTDLSKSTSPDVVILLHTVTTSAIWLSATSCRHAFRDEQRCYFEHFPCVSSTAFSEHFPSVAKSWLSSYGGCLSADLVTPCISDVVIILHTVATFQKLWFSDWWQAFFCGVQTGLVHTILWH